MSEQGINFAWQPLLFLYNADHIRNAVRHPLVKAGGPLLTTDHKLNPWSSLQTTIKVTLFDDGHLWILLHISVWVTCFHLLARQAFPGNNGIWRWCLCTVYWALAGKSAGLIINHMLRYPYIGFEPPIKTFSLILNIVRCCLLFWYQIKLKVNQRGI